MSARWGRAPGKLVLSGAYSVLWGAPAIVTAVDRYAFADPARPAQHVADEVAHAVTMGLVPRPCFVDVSALRAPVEGGGSRKLGLGSSSAILLATLVALGEAPESAAHRAALFRAALGAHRSAQGGGSGIDVAASTFGGTLRFQLGPDATAPRVAPCALPPGTIVRVFAAEQPAQTSALVARVRAFAEREQSTFTEILAAATEGAERAAAAGTTAALADALGTQTTALAELGDRAGVPIVPAALRKAHALAREADAHFGPSGAGGGDVAFYLGDAPPSDALLAAIASAGLAPLELSIEAPGATRIDPR